MAKEEMLKKAKGRKKIIPTVTITYSGKDNHAIENAKQILVQAYVNRLLRSERENDNKDGVR